MSNNDDDAAIEEWRKNGTPRDQRGRVAVVGVGDQDQDGGGRRGSGNPGCGNYRNNNNGGGGGFRQQQRQEGGGGGQRGRQDGFVQATMTNPYRAMFDNKDKDQWGSTTARGLPGDWNDDGHNQRPLKEKTVVNEATQEALKDMLVSNVEFNRPLMNMNQEVFDVRKECAEKMRQMATAMDSLISATTAIVYAKDAIIRMSSEMEKMCAKQDSILQMNSAMEQMCPKEDPKLTAKKDELFLHQFRKHIDNFGSPADEVVTVPDRIERTSTAQPAKRQEQRAVERPNPPRPASVSNASRPNAAARPANNEQQRRGATFTFQQRENTTKPVGTAAPQMRDEKDGHRGRGPSGGGGVAPAATTTTTNNKKNQQSTPTPATVVASIPKETRMDIVKTEIVAAKKEEVVLPPRYIAKAIPPKPAAPEGWTAYKHMNRAEIRASSTEHLKKSLALLEAATAYEEKFAEWNEMNMEEIRKMVDSEDERRRIRLTMKEVAF